MSGWDFPTQYGLVGLSLVLAWTQWCAPARLREFVLQYGRTASRSPYRWLYVPKSWFSHFYFYSFVLCIVGIRHQYPRVSVPGILMTLQSLRRWVECLLQPPSSARMLVAHYGLGVFYYTILNHAVWVRQCRMVSMEQLWCAVFLYAVGAIVQTVCHAQLRRLKKYSPPPWKKMIAPHYTSEIVLYIGMALACPNPTMIANIPFVCLELFVAGKSSQEWYRQKFGSDVPVWILMPYVI